MTKFKVHDKVIITGSKLYVGKEAMVEEVLDRGCYRVRVGDNKDIISIREKDMELVGSEKFSNYTFTGDIAFSKHKSHPAMSILEEIIQDVNIKKVDISPQSKDELLMESEPVQELLDIVPCLEKIEDDSVSIRSSITTTDAASSVTSSGRKRGKKSKNEHLINRLDNGRIQCKGCGDDFADLSGASKHINGRCRGEHADIPDSASVMTGATRTTIMTKAQQENMQCIWWDASKCTSERYNGYLCEYHRKRWLLTELDKETLWEECDGELVMGIRTDIDSLTSLADLGRDGYIFYTSKNGGEIYDRVENQDIFNNNIKTISSSESGATINVREKGTPKLKDVVSITVGQLYAKLIKTCNERPLVFDKRMEGAYCWECLGKAYTRNEAKADKIRQRYVEARKNDDSS